jgi:hypothetical protein
VNGLWTFGLVLTWIAIFAGCWLGWQLLRQNGRMLLRLEELEKRLDELEFGEDEQPVSLPVGVEASLADPSTPDRNREHESLVTSAATGNGESRASRFANQSLARSKIKRDGLKAGTPAPDFRLPRLDGRGELSLSELRGRRVLLVFSSPVAARATRSRQS